MQRLLSSISIVFVLTGLLVSSGIAQSRGKASNDETQCTKASGDEAITACSRFITSGRARGRSLAVAYNTRGIAYKHKGDYDRAIADSSEAIRLDPKYVHAYYNRGAAYWHKDDTDGAIADYSEAIRLNPKHAFPYNNRGVAYKDKGDNDRAIADYNEAIRLDPKYAAPYHNRGLAYKDKGNYDRAIADYSEAIRLDPKYVDRHFDRGLAYELKGDFANALADFRSVLALAPNDKFADDAVRRMEHKLAARTEPNRRFQSPISRRSHPTSPSAASRSLSATALMRTLAHLPIPAMTPRRSGTH